MVVAPFALQEGYWESFEVRDADIEFLYNFLLEKETPLTTRELAVALAEERIRNEKLVIEKKRSSGGAIYFPKDQYQEKQSLIFPALNWQRGKVVAVRPGQNPDLGAFEVIQVALENGETREFASGIAEHILNQPPEMIEQEEGLDLNYVLANFGDDLEEYLEESLLKNPDFVRIAGRWFPRALLVDINTGHLNLAEAVLDMAGGGPSPTTALMEQVGLQDVQNSKLTEFSLDLALEEDPRFDEVGPSGEVLWFLNRLEPEGVLKPHLCLRYNELEYDRATLSESMLALEKELDDELSPLAAKPQGISEAQLPLIFPHWRAGTLPLSTRIRHLFPTAYEAPRIRFMLVDGDTGEKFPGWVVRSQRYIFGLSDWYHSKGAMPGTLIKVKKGKNPGEVVVQCETHRPNREWVRTVLVGSDGGVVFAMLKQQVTTVYDERMAIAVPDPEALDLVWQQTQKDHVPFERTLVNTVRELAKLTPQSHVHATELYTAVNVVRRCPPGPILALLASRPWFSHVGDLHFRFDDSERM
jgi:hypothetical protein